MVVRSSSRTARVRSAAVADRSALTSRCASRTVSRVVRRKCQMLTALRTRPRKKSSGMVLPEPTPIVPLTKSENAAVISHIHRAARGPCQAAAIVDTISVTRKETGPNGSESP